MHCLRLMANNPILVHLVTDNLKPQPAHPPGAAGKPMNLMDWLSKGCQQAKLMLSMPVEEQEKTKEQVLEELEPTNLSEKEKKDAAEKEKQPAGFKTTPASSKLAKRAPESSEGKAQGGEEKAREEAEAEEHVMFGLAEDLLRTHQLLTASLKTHGKRLAAVQRLFANHQHVPGEPNESERTDVESKESESKQLDVDLDAKGREEVSL